MSPDRRQHAFDRRRPVLIVSANPDVLDLYVLSWRSERTAVVSVSSVPEAAHLLREHAISAVVLDVSNPAVDWDVCGQLVAAAEESLPLIVLTGWIDQEARDQAFACGCAAFVAKPASPMRLREIVQRTRAGERGIIAVP
jgi:CheY-like chemotaxis protein